MYTVDIIFHLKIKRISISKQAIMKDPLPIRLPTGSQTKKK